MFPSGCFFASAAAEWDARPGPVRDRLATISRHWTELIETALRDAQERAALDPDTDVAQIAFEINAMLGEANGRFVLHGDRSALERAQRGIQDRLATRARRHH